MRLTFVLLSAVLVARAAVAQPPALPDRVDALVAASRTFVFYSDAVTNLHDFLVWNARSREPVEPAPDCFAGLSAEQRTAFEHAHEHYKVFATPAGNRLLLALRYRLAGFGDFDIADSAAMELRSRSCGRRHRRTRNAGGRRTTLVIDDGSRPSSRCWRHTKMR